MAVPDSMTGKAMVYNIGLAADILLVAFGAPRQDLWIAANHQRLAVQVAFGVGGLFDF